MKLRIEDTMIPCIACLSNKHLHGDMESANRLQQLYIVVAVAATVAATDYRLTADKTQTRLRRRVVSHVESYRT